MPTTCRGQLHTFSTRKTLLEKVRGHHDPHPRVLRETGEFLQTWPST